MTVIEVNEEKGKVEKVRMNDGREVEFAGKKVLLKETIIDEHSHPAVRLDFRNGETRLFKVPHNLLAQFAAHGASQKLGDETAGYKAIDQASGSVNTDVVDDMVMAVDDLIERLNKGEWTSRREGSGFAGTSTLLRALVELSGKTVDQIKEFLKGKSQQEKMALRNSAKVKPIIERLEAEKMAKSAKVDTESLLAELE